MVEGLNWTLQLLFYLIFFFCGFRDRFWYSFITVISEWHDNDEPLTFAALLKTKPSLLSTKIRFYRLNSGWLFFWALQICPCWRFSQGKSHHLHLSLLYYSSKTKNSNTKIVLCRGRWEFSSWEFTCRSQSEKLVGFFMLIPSGQTDKSYRPLN